MDDHDARDHDHALRRDWLVMLQAKNDQLDRCAARIRELEDEVRALRDELESVSQKT